MTMTPGLFSLIFFGGAALIFLIYAIFTAMGKGPILCPPYFGATKEQKAKMDKKKEYRKLTILNLIIAVILGAMGIYFYFSTLGTTF